MLYAIYQAGGPNLFGVAHSSNLVNEGTRVSLSEGAWQVGDIISFDNGQHFAIYAGNGNVVDADTAFYQHPDGVSESPLSWYLTAFSVTQVLRFT